MNLTIYNRSLIQTNYRPSILQLIVNSYFHTTVIGGKRQDTISSENNRRYVGEIVEVLVDSVSRHKGKKVVNSRTLSNKLVHFEGDESMIGKFMEVKIDRAGVYELYATKKD